MPTIEKIRQELENISINRINADLEINSLIEEEELNRQIDDEKINLKIYKNELKGLLNEQDKIIARDSTSTYPNEAIKKPSVGYMRALSSEGVLSI